MASFYSKFLDFIGIEETDDEGGGNYYEDDRRSYGRNGRDDSRYDRYDNRRDRGRDQETNVSYNARGYSRDERSSGRYSKGSDEEFQQNAGNLPISGGQKMIVYHPVSYEDTQSIIDNLKNRKPVIVNMEELDVETAQRILDFLSGAVYAMDGTMCKIARNIFVVAPNSYDVVGNGEDTEYGEY